MANRWTRILNRGAARVVLGTSATLALGITAYNALDPNPLPNCKRFEIEGRQNFNRPHDVWYVAVLDGTAIPEAVSETGLCEDALTACTTDNDCTGILVGTCSVAGDPRAIEEAQPIHLVGMRHHEQLIGQITIYTVSKKAWVASS